MIGRCLCGQIEFEFEPRDGVAMNCHCSMCRRAHGAAFASMLLSSKDSLKFIKGSEALKEYYSSEFGVRAFCSECGSRLMNYAKSHSNYMSVALSAVVDECGIKPAANVQVGSKASWYTPAEDIPAFEEFPPDIGKYFA